MTEYEEKMLEALNDIKIAIRELGNKTDILYDNLGEFSPFVSGIYHISDHLGRIVQNLEQL